MLSQGSGAADGRTLPSGIRSVQAGVLHAHTLIASFLRSACTAGNCASAVFLLHNPDSSHFILSVLDPKGRLLAKEVSLDPSSMAYSAFTTRRTAVSSVPPAAAPGSRVPETIAAVPVVDGGILWGVLELFNSHDSGGFDGRRVDVLEAFAADFSFCLSQCYESGALDFFPFVARDAVSKDLLSVMDSLSLTSSPVLILGEEGTGRSFLARHLHAQGALCVCPFVSVQCRTMGSSDSDVAVILAAAGEERGGGLLFFDEVSRLSLANQKALLSFMQRGSGPWRIVSSASEEMEALVSDGRFIPELYHRLSVMPVNVCPLRQRPGDTAALAGRFLRAGNRELGKAVRGFSDDAVSYLSSRVWEGNLHELKIAVASAVLRCDGDIIQTAHVVPGEECLSEGTSLHDAVTRFKRAHVSRVLEQTGWNQTEAARLLGVQRTYVSKLIAELGLRR